jgi:hypothetical protein
MCSPGIMRLWLLLLLSTSVVQAADICNPVALVGPYVVQLAGTTTISGEPQPTVSLARLIFDGSGKISGTSSATFSGLLLGNPVTGTYEAQADCSLTWKLQDDSGAYQNFGGKLTPDLMRAQVRQTDTGGTRGVLEKTSDSCMSTDLRKRYSYVAAGAIKAMTPGQASRNVSAKGVVDSGSFQVDSDCAVHFVLNLPDANANARGFLVSGGNEILAFQTDPGAMVSIRMTAEAQ